MFNGCGEMYFCLSHMAQNCFVHNVHSFLANLKVWRDAVHIKLWVPAFLVAYARINLEKIAACCMLGFSLVHIWTHSSDIEAEQQRATANERHHKVQSLKVPKVDFRSSPLYTI